MAINFPDPDSVTEYTHITDDGVSIKYVWDGEKWSSASLSGGGGGGSVEDVNTSQVTLVKSISNPFTDLPDLDTLQTQEEYNEYVYTAVKDIYLGEADYIIDAKEYS